MAVTNGHFKTLGIAEEGSYGSLSAGVPDASGLTFYSLDCTATLTTIAGESPVDDDVGTRDGSWRRAPRPAAAYNEGSSRWQARMEGSFTVEGQVDPLGSGGFSDYDTHPLAVMLGTFMAKLADPAASSEGVAGSGGANELTATTSTLYTEGAIIGHNDSGTLRFAQVTNKVGTAITHNPSLDSAGLTIGNTVQLFRTYYVPAVGESPDVESFAARFDSGGSRFYAVGCVVESATFSETEGGHLRFSFTVRSPYIYPDHGNAALDPVDFAGEIFATRYNAPFVVSTDVASTTAPYTSAAIDLDPRPGSAETAITVTLDQSAHLADGMPYKLTPLAVDVTMSVVIDDPSSSIANDFETRTHRTVVLGYGPLIGGAGVALMMPRAHLTASAQNREAPDGQAVQQTLTYRPNKGFAVADTSNVAFSPFLIGLGL